MTLETFLEKKIIGPEQLEKKLEEIRKAKKTIATLNGSFDLLHAGHLEMIYQASLQGDILLVALNSDASIQGYKSPERPIIPLEYRLQLMASLSFVSYVTWFHERDPCNFLSLVKPDVHVNGAEYGENCIEAPIVKAHGGRIHIVELVPGLSTSAIIQKITQLK
jgi:D-glycero-beta-D-manno-heptose 1-phosphate adenylyltransferase